MTIFFKKRKIDFYAIAIKLDYIFHSNKKQFQNFVWNHCRPQTAETIPRMKNKARGILLDEFKL